MDRGIEDAIVGVFKPPFRCGGCEYLTQGKGRMYCNHPDAIKFIEIKEPCNNCGRKPGIKKGGCGGCIGRGLYVYPNIYDICDCGGFKSKTN